VKRVVSVGSQLAVGSNLGEAVAGVQELQNLRATPVSQHRKFDNEDDNDNESELKRCEPALGTLRENVCKRVPPGHFATGSNWSVFCTPESQLPFKSVPVANS
jgi:hypothetical protein